MPFEALIRFLNEVRLTRAALRLVGMDLQQARHVRHRVQVFSLAWRSPAGHVRAGGSATPGVGSGEESDQALQLLEARLAALGSPKAAETPPEVSDPSVPGAENIPAHAQRVRMKFRRFVAAGPSHVMAGGKRLNWSADLEKTPHNLPRRALDEVTLHPEARVTHLVTRGNSRYCPEDTCDVQVVEVGSTIAVEARGTHQVLFADAQGELKFAEPLSEI